MVFLNIYNILFLIRFKNIKDVHDLGALVASSRPIDFSKFWTRAANEAMGKDWWIKLFQSGMRKFSFDNERYFSCQDLSLFSTYIFATRSRIKDVDMHCQVLSIYQTLLKCRNSNNVFTDENLGMVYFNREMLIRSCFQDTNLWVWYRIRPTGEIKKTWKPDCKYSYYSTRKDKQNNIL